MLLVGDSRKRMSLSSASGFLHKSDSSAAFCLNCTCPPQVPFPQTRFWGSNISHFQPELDAFRVSCCAVVDTVYSNWNIIQKGS